MYFAVGLRLGRTILFVNGIEVAQYNPAQLIKSEIGYTLSIPRKELEPYFVSGSENVVTVKAYTASNDMSSRGVPVRQAVPRNVNSHPNLYAVIVGVSDYKGIELDLKYPDKDARDFAGALERSAKKLLNTDSNEHVFIYRLHTGPDRYLWPEKNSIKTVLQEIGRKSTANDILLIFFAGHGVMEGVNKQFYFLAADASKATSFGTVADVGISVAELSEWMKPELIKAQKRILIFDACNSGQAINEMVKIGGKEQKYIAARSDTRTQQIRAIEKLSEKSGLYILAASASGQSAYEMSRFSQGLLTYSLLKAIRQQPDILEENKFLSVSRWFNAAEKTVSDISTSFGNGQQPQIVSAGNFHIGIVDDEVINSIQLAEEKPLFGPANFQNSDPGIADDDIGFTKYINSELSETSLRGGDSEIGFVSNSNTPDAWTLSGRYTISGDSINVQAKVRQNGHLKFQLQISGDKMSLNTLAANVVAQAIREISNQRRQK